MFMVCKCLNVAINVTNIPSEYAGDWKSENDHSQFFKKAIGPFLATGANFQQLDLIQKIRTADNWVLHHCINCDTYTHAINDKNLYLINPLLLTNEEDTNILKTSVKYSNLFGVLINQDMSSTKLDVADKDNDTIRIKNLTQHFRDAIQQEINETNNRITKFNEEQFRLLGLFREKANQEYNALVRIIKTVPEQSTNSNVAEQLAGSKMTSFDTPPPTPDSTPMSIGNSPNFKHQPRIVTDKQQTLSSATKNGSVRTAPTQPPAKATDDSIFFFEMDGIPNPRSNQYTNAMSDVEESDTDESDVDTSHQRYAGRPKSLNIAQSLPVSMPVVANNRDVVQAEYDEYSDENVDIAASIKAIAKSVHGEGVFGDLPRPRFSTEI
ncbi:hypothetical protein HA402_010858 [Bradysia odoriphaga]|nr:hypothetical protein HA402_010858 [Bradysia odoriphaga]